MDTNASNDSLPKRLMSNQPNYYRHQMACSLPYQDEFQERIYAKFGEVYGDECRARFEEAMLATWRILCPNSDATRVVLDTNFPVIWCYLKKHVPGLSPPVFDSAFGEMWVSNIMTRATIRFVTVIELD